ncbi:MAG TPA: ATP-binding protein, partial [Acidimicrobiales bacterium]|nr:ATP-binding protein [Acidimicrobiales bacterium]
MVSTPGGNGRRGLGRPRRVVVFSGALSVGALLILGTAAIRLSSDAARSQAQRQASAAASASAVAVEQEMIGLSEVVDAFAKRPTVVAAFASGSRGEKFARDMRFHLDELRSSRPGISLAFLTESSGVLVDVLPETPEIIGRDFSFRDWFQGVRSTGRPYVSEVYDTAATGENLVVAAAAPIHSSTVPGSPMAGVLVAGYRLDTIQRFVDDFAAAQSVALTVTDQNGVVVASPGTRSDTLAARQGESEAAGAQEGRGDPGEEVPRNDRVVSAHSPIPKLGWALTAEIPAEAALAELSGVRGALFVILGILAAVLLLGLAALDRVLRRRAETEDQLQRSQAFLDSVVENIPHMVFVKDASDLKFVRINRAGEGLVGYPREEMIGHTVEEFFPADQAEFYSANDREVLRGGQPLDIPAEPVRTHDCGVRTVHTTKIPIFGPDGKPEYLLGISEDITEQQEARAALEQARSDAQRANHAKSAFLSRMSHELRTPLNSVIGFSQLLELDELAPEQADSAAQITKAGRHLLGLINEVLDIARVESGELRLSLEPVDFREVVDEAIRMVIPLAAARGVRLDGLDESVSTHVLADRQRLKQVVVNLLANAVKYNRDGGSVAAHIDERSESRVRLEVVDTGIGIAPQHLDRLFLPFDRLGAEESEVEGTGLGLTLTKQLVEAMGGEIGASSAVGIGSTFWVEFTTTEPLSDTGNESSAPAFDGAGNAGDVARSILYVEDNLANVKLVERILARRPEVTCIVAMQGGIALDLALEHQPSLILLDLHLPDVSGEEVLRRLRADQRTAAIPIVVLSADAIPGQAERLKRIGATDYLTKPFEIGRFLEVVDTAGRVETPPPAEPALAEEVGPLDAKIVSSLQQLGKGSEAGAVGLRELITGFLDDSATRFDELLAALTAGEPDEVARVAHSLVGSTASYGAKDF